MGSANAFKRVYSGLAGGLQEKLPRSPTNLLVKQLKTTMPKLHATYPMTLNFQTYLKKMLKRFYLTSIPVKPLEWNKYRRNFWGTVLRYWLFLWENGEFVNNIVNLSRRVKYFWVKAYIQKRCKEWSQELPPYFPLATSIRVNWRISSLSSRRLP